MKGTFSGGLVAHDGAEIAGVDIVGDEGSLAQDLGFVLTGALETPPALGDLFDQDLFDLGGRLMVQTQLRLKRFVLLELFLWAENEVPRGEPVFQGVHLAILFAGLGTGASGTFAFRRFARICALLP